MSAPQIIRDLVEKFDRNFETYKKATNETQVRREFIDPFFKALGWDIDNEHGAAPQYQDVIHEDQLKIKGSMKAPDYAFRIGGQKKFYVEAKKPSVFVKDDPAPALQVRTYAWNAKLDLSIVTDFEEFAIYECSSKPKHGDKPNIGRVNYYTYKDYLDKWDEIAGIFSKDSVLKGSFDKYAAGSKGKRGTQTVDKAFLAEIEKWRELLAKNFAKNNKITEEEMKFATQRTLDRIIFLRICESRGIEEEGRLMECVNTQPSPLPLSRSTGRGVLAPSPGVPGEGRGEGTSAYQRLFALFQAADNRYNSGLFYFRKGDKAHTSESELDTITPQLKLDDKILKEIIGGLYYPSPYLFDVIPADILGQVYEQFLGKVIRMTSGGMVKIEEKPEVRKAGGVYYTPTYIVDYIVKNTVGKMLEEEKKEKPTLKILDPACGSGSFLLGAYNYLLHWYLGKYSKNAAVLLKQKNSPIYAIGSKSVIASAAKQSPEVSTESSLTNQQRIASSVATLPPRNDTLTTYALTTPERKRILLEHIYGVDIDEQAVEVAKLNLMLKCLEGEAGTNLKLSVERILPDLSDNIKCGNSLIGHDFNDGLFADDEQKKINPFDWNSEFSDIMKKGGFDVVIGNPPYVRQETLGQEFKSYVKKKFETYHDSADLYTYFIEQGIKLLRDGGIFSYIVANKWMRANYGIPLRNWMKKQCIEEIIDFGDLQVFRGATTYPCILTIARAKTRTKFKAVNMKDLEFSDLSEVIKTESFDIETDALQDGGWSLTSDLEYKLIKKLKERSTSLSNYVNNKIYYGIKTGLNEGFVIDDEARTILLNADKKSIEVIKPFLAGRDVKRYQEPNANKYLILIPSGWTNKQNPDRRNPFKSLEDKYPAIANYLLQYKEKAMARYDQGDYWWELRSCDYYEAFGKPRIIVPTIVAAGSNTYSEEIIYSNDKTCVIASGEKYLVAILNSKLCDYFIHSIASTKSGGYYEYKPMYISQIPIANGNKDLKNKLVSLVDRMLSQNKELPQAKTPQSRTQLERQIANTDTEIDRQVYALYGLTEEEIGVVEGKI